MKITNKPLVETADISAARGKTLSEFWKLVFSALVLLAAVYFLVEYAVDLAVGWIPYETEAKVFSSFALPGVEPQNEEKQASLKRLQSVIDLLKKDKSVPSLPYSIFLMEDEEPNAFAFPGGLIGVTTGLAESLDEDIEFAFVLGHELGHYKHRDHLRGMGRAVSVSLLFSALFSGGSGAESFGNLLNFVLQRNYSQSMEKKADRFGVELVYATYGKVEGVEALFQLLKEKKSRLRWAYMFSTHPSPDERIRELESYARRFGEK